MTETGGPEKGASKFRSAINRGVDAAKRVIDNTKVSAHSRLGEPSKRSPQEMRDENLTNPTYNFLQANHRYQQWRDEGAEPPLPEFSVTYASIRDGRPVDTLNPANAGYYLEKIIDPTLDKTTLKEKSVEYCRETATSFLETARNVAQDLSTAEESPTV